MNELLKVGVGRADITPGVGDWLMGYSPARQAESIHDHLHLTAFVFESEGVRAMLAVADVCNIPTDLSEEIRQQMAVEANVPYEHIILSATHTHSGPGTRPLTGSDPETIAKYTKNVFCPAALQAAREAGANLRPARMGIGQTMSDVGINRREMKEDGGVKLGQEPFGSYDPVMTVISFREPDGTPIGNLIHYGCHNTGSGKNTEITRDWCGVAIDRLEAEAGGVTAFFNGCEGDVGPRLANGRTTGNLQLALELGGRAAVDAVRAFRSIREWREVGLKTLPASVTMEYAPLPTLEQTEKDIEALGDPSLLKGLDIGTYNLLRARREMLASGEEIPDTEEIPEALLALGPVAFLPIPFEVFSQITLRIKRHSPFPYTVCVGCANGSRSYFPSQDQLCRGGYEVKMFRKRAHPFRDDSDQTYMTGAVKILRELYEQE